MKNVHGDVVGITDAEGNVEARYTYDTWGKLVSITHENDMDRTTDTDFIGYINPIRYRGYYYDSETGLYYLNARYYDPETCRFLNADETLKGGLNLFAYCYNNPSNLRDFSGKNPGDLFDSIDEAATDWGRCFNNQSIVMNREFASLIYLLPTGKFSYTQPQIGGKIGMSIEYSRHISGEPYAEVGNDHYPMVAAIHSHGAYALILDSDNFSDKDIKSSLKFGRPLYLVSPGGYLKKYDNISGETLVLSTDMPNGPNHGKFWHGLKHLII